MRSAAFILPLFLASCYSTETMLLKRPVPLPFVYYSIEASQPGISTRERVSRPPKVAYWDVPVDGQFWHTDSLFLFTGNAELEKTYEAIRSGRGSEAIGQLEAALKTYENNRSLVGLLHNNLAIAYLTDEKIKKAKFHIDQAGIINLNHYILQNARIITGIMQKNLVVVKYGPGEKEMKPETKVKEGKKE